VQWTKAQPCVVTGLTGDVEVVHVRNGGMGLKAEARWTVPMRSAYHRQLHQIGKASFEEVYGVNLDALAKHTQAAWEQYEAENWL
jgi:hypothetical protein